MKVKLLYHTPDIELNIAKAAGICYDSKVTKPTQLVKRLKEDGHFATFRFGQITFHISGISRACSMQMLRHKFLDFLQRSQRYCNEKNTKFMIPPSIKDNGDAKLEYNYALDSIQSAYSILLKLGIPKEDARYILPNACHTELNVTGSIQAWWDFLYGNAGRLQPAAQWEIRGVAEEIERQLHEIAPNIFGGNNATI